MGTIQDVYTGLKGLVTGKSAYQQQKESNEALFKKLTPPPNTTIIKTTKGPVYVSGGSGGGQPAPTSFIVLVTSYSALGKNPAGGAYFGFDNISPPF